MSQVDIFSPFRRRTEQHEDRLTWGLLVALKYAPSLQRFLRDLVMRRVPAERWPSGGIWDPASISTQTAQLGADTSFVVSVLVSGDSLDEAVEVKPSDRVARYDGVIEYSDGLVLIVENKPQRSDVRVGQLSPSRSSFEGLPDEAELFEEAVSIEWADVLEGILSFAGSPTTSYPERIVAEDFLSFAEDLHPALSPYRTFDLCGNRTEALSKRVGLLLSALARGLRLEVGIRPGAQPYLHLPNEVVRQVHLSVHDDADSNGLMLRLSIWPGDTAGQARAFLDHVNEQGFLDLPAAGWHIWSNLHFSHVQKHLVWAESPLDVSDYLAYFQEHPDQIGRTKFDDVDLESLIQRWKSRELISPVDEAALRRKFGETRRGYLNLVPGFCLTREWPLPSVIKMESEGRLESDLIAALHVALATWGESLPEWVSA